MRQIDYHYDALDRLIATEQPGAPATTYLYRDGRVATQSRDDWQHSLVQPGDHLLARCERSGTQVINTLLATDRQRSVLQSVSGDTTHRSAYTPYGERPVDHAILNLPGFNGELPDPVTGCYLLGNGYRAYNPVLMRFHSPDSMSPFESGGINPYAYCLGDPVSRSDPTGHFSWKSILSIAIAVAAIAITVVTLGSGIPLTGPMIFSSLLGIGSEVLSVIGTLARELVPDSNAGSALGQFSLALGLLSLSVPHAAKFAASRGARAAARTFVPGPVTVARQGAVRVSNGQSLRSLSGTAGLGRGARNTVALQERLNMVSEIFSYVKYVGYGVKALDVAENALIPYLQPASGDGAEQPATALETFVFGEGTQGTQQGLQQGAASIRIRQFLTEDQQLIEAIRIS